MAPLFLRFRSQTAFVKELKRDMHDTKSIVAAEFCGPRLNKEIAMYNNHDESNNPTFMTHVRRIPETNQVEHNECSPVELDDSSELPSHITVVPFIKTQTGSFQ